LPRRCRADHYALGQAKGVVRAWLDENDVSVDGCVDGRLDVGEVSPRTNPDYRSVEATSKCDQDNCDRENEPNGSWQHRYASRFLLLVQDLRESLDLRDRARAS
jgi:hypothetical protein